MERDHNHVAESTRPRTLRRERASGRGHEPPTGNHALLALQRTAGNRAVTLAVSRQTPPTATAVPGTDQAATDGQPAQNAALASVWDATVIAPLRRAEAALTGPRARVRAAANDIDSALPTLRSLIRTYSSSDAPLKERLQGRFNALGFRRLQLAPYLGERPAPVRQVGEELRPTTDALEAMRGDLH